MIARAKEMVEFIGIIWVSLAVLYKISSDKISIIISGEIQNTKGELKKQIIELRFTLLFLIAVPSLLLLLTILIATPTIIMILCNSKISLLCINIHRTAFVFEYIGFIVLAWLWFSLIKKFFIFYSEAIKQKKKQPK